MRRHIHLFNPPRRWRSSQFLAVAVALGACGGETTSSDLVGDDVGVRIQTNGAVFTSETGDEGTFTITLTFEPTAPVRLLLSSSDDGEGTVTPSEMTFTPTNWQSLKTVTVRGQDDDEADGDQNFKVVVGSPESDDSRYASLGAKEVAVVNLDDDSAAIRTRGELIVAEGNEKTAVLEVRLSTAPAADVNLSVTVNGDEASASPTQLTFTTENWGAFQKVRISSQDDDDIDGDQPFEVVLQVIDTSDVAYAALAPVTVEGLNLDNESAGLRVSYPTPLVTSESGAEEDPRISVSLGYPPTGDVTVPFRTDSDEILLSAESLVFTPDDWDAVQFVEVVGLDDTERDGDQRFTIQLDAAVSTDPNYAGIGARTIEGVNQDNDGARVLVTGRDLRVSEAGATDTFTVKLATPPTDTVSIPLESSNDEVTIEPSILTFTPSDWENPQTVTVTGVDDSKRDGDQRFRVWVRPAISEDLDYHGVNPRNPEGVNADNDSPEIVVTHAGPLDIDEGGSVELFVWLLHEPTAQVRIGIENSKAWKVKASTSEMTFTRNNWDTPQTLVLENVDNDRPNGTRAFEVSFSVIGSDDAGYAALPPKVLEGTALDNDRAGVTIDRGEDKLNTSEDGRRATFTVALRTQPRADVTIEVRKTDTGLREIKNTVEVDLQFTLENWDQPQTVTVEGADDDFDDGDREFVLSLTTFSDDEIYNMRHRTIIGSNDDNDTLALEVVGASSPFVLTEGEATDVELRLTARPPSNVDVATFRIKNHREISVVGGGSFSFSDWKEPTTVRLRVADDGELTGPRSVHVFFEANFARTLSFSIRVHDAQGTSGLVVRGVNYDGPTQNSDRVRIFNLSPFPRNLDGIELIFVDGKTNQDYRRYPLSGELGPHRELFLAHSDYYPEISPNVIHLRFDDFEMQDGSEGGDGVMLVDTNTEEMLDALSYEGAITEAEVDINGTLLFYDLTEGGTPTDVADTPNNDVRWLARINDQDSDNPANDWGYKLWIL